MKETKNKEWNTEQKVYAAFISLGICALVAVSVIYGVRSIRSNSLVEQKIQLGEDNPVSGPVADEDNENNPPVSRDNEKLTTEIESKEPVETEKKEAKNNLKSVSGYDGKEELSWPVMGSVIIPYSMDTTVYFETLDQYQCNPALYIKAEKDTEVKAVFAGVISEVAKSDRYGNLITLDMGNGYKTYYGQLSDVTVKKGDKVEKGTLLGKVGDPTDYFILEGNHLYFKMTYQGKEINPTEYMEF